MKDKYLLVISIFIAISMWLYVFSSENIDSVINLPVEVFDEQDGYMTFVKPKEVSVRLSGPQTFVSKARSTKLILSVKDKPSGKSYTELTAKNIKTIGLEVVDISPDIVEFEIVKTVKRAKNVLPNIIGEPPKGFKVDQISVSPSQVEVEGNYSDINIIDSIKTTPVNITDFKENDTLTVELLNYYGIKNIIPNRVKLSINIVEDIVVETISTKLKCAAGTTTNMELPSITMVLKGRKDYIENSQASSFVEIDCSLIGTKPSVPVIRKLSDENTVQILSIFPPEIKLGL